MKIETNLIKLISAIAVVSVIICVVVVSLKSNKLESQEVNMLQSDTVVSTKKETSTPTQSTTTSIQPTTAAVLSKTEYMSLCERSRFNYHLYYDYPNTYINFYTTLDLTYIGWDNNGYGIAIYNYEGKNKTIVFSGTNTDINGSSLDLNSNIRIYGRYVGLSNINGKNALNFNVEYIKKIEETTQSQTREQYIASTVPLDFDAYSRRPDDYKGTQVNVELEIDYISNDYILCYMKYNSKYYNKRVVLFNGFYDVNGDRILKDDIVTVYGEFKGLAGEDAFVYDNELRVDAKYVIRK